MSALRTLPMRRVLVGRRVPLPGGKSTVSGEHMTACVGSEGGSDRTGGRGGQWRAALRHHGDPARPEVRPIKHDCTLDRHVF